MTNESPAVEGKPSTDMRPYAYYTVMRQSQDPRFLRLRMALYAKEHGVKPAARAFKVTPKTIRKWLGRFDGKLASLDEQSSAPHKRTAPGDARSHRPNACCARSRKSGRSFSRSTWTPRISAIFPSIGSLSRA